MLPRNQEHEEEARMEDWISVREERHWESQILFSRKSVNPAPSDSYPVRCQPVILRKGISALLEMDSNPNWTSVLFFLPLSCCKVDQSGLFCDKFTQMYLHLAFLPRKDGTQRTQFTVPYIIRNILPPDCEYLRRQSSHTHKNWSHGLESTKMICTFSFKSPIPKFSR